MTMQLGRKPAVRHQIETALADYQRGGATPEIKALFTDWATIVQATLAQATRFELIHDMRPEEDRAIVNMWFQVMRVRSQQNSVEAKLVKRLQQLRQPVVNMPVDVPGTPLTVFAGSTEELAEAAQVCAEEASQPDEAEKGGAA
jgi:hypothetical protein